MHRSAFRSFARKYLVIALLAGTPTAASADIFDFSYSAGGSGITVAGTGYFSTSSSADGTYSLGSSITGLTFTSSTITGLPVIAQFLANSFSPAFVPPSIFTATVSGGNLSDIFIRADGNGSQSIGPFDADYGFSYQVLGLTNNLSGNAYINGTGPLADFSDNFAGLMNFTKREAPPQANGFTILDGQIASSVFSVTDPGTVSGLSLEMFGFEHGYVGDLTFTLSHLGTSVVFSDPWGDRLTGSGTSMDVDGDYVFADGVTPSFFDATLVGTDLPPGTYGTTGDAFAAFDGMDRAGDWTLSIADNAKLDEGSLGRWALAFGAPSVSAVPEPATWLSMMFGLAIMGASLRRRRVSCRSRRSVDRRELARLNGA